MAQIINGVHGHDIVRSGRFIQEPKIDLKTVLNNLHKDRFKKKLDV